MLCGVDEAVLVGVGCIPLGDGCMLWLAVFVLSCGEDSVGFSISGANKILNVMIRQKTAMKIFAGWESVSLVSE